MIACSRQRKLRNLYFMSPIFLWKALWPRFKTLNSDPNTTEQRRHCKTTEYRCFTCYRLGLLRKNSYRSNKTCDINNVSRIHGIIRSNLQYQGRNYFQFLFASRRATTFLCLCQKDWSKQKHYTFKKICVFFKAGISRQPRYLCYFIQEGTFTTLEAASKNACLRLHFTTHNNLNNFTLTLCHGSIEIQWLIPL